MSYTVEVLNLGKKPLADVIPSTTTLDDREAAEHHHCWAVGEMAMRPGLALEATDRVMDIGEDGVLASARFTHEDDGGRVEVLLRRRAD